MIKSIPLNKLVQSPRNVRRHGDPAADAELKASIAARGLLQNLIVRPAAKGKFEVEAGERRRRAMLALADEKLLARDYEVTCLVLEDSAEAAVETSLAENFHRLAMNPADEAQAFAALVAGGATVEDVARRFGLTVRFVEGRLRLATLAPVVFEALAAGEITLDIAKAFGATSDQDIQTRVFEQVSSGYYAPNPDSVRRMVLSGTVRGSDPRARLVGRDAYIAAGGRIERELFDNDDSESWVDVALLECLAAAKMEEQAKALAAEQGLAWVKPTLDPYASHDLVDGLVRLPAEPAPLTEAELARLDELDASYDEHAAILEDEDSAEEAVAAAEAAIEAIDRECQDIRARPPVIAPELKAEAGMVLVLSRDGTPVLQPVFYGERQADPTEANSGIEVVSGEEGSEKRRTTLSKRLVDELAMQRRDVLALHVASDPGLALDIMVFTLADADTHDWRARPSTTLRAPVPAGPIKGPDRDMLTTRDAISLEQRILAGIEAGRGVAPAIVPAFDAGTRLQAVSHKRYGIILNKGQEGAGRMLLSSNNRIVAIQGVAGAGKSTVLKPVADILRTEGKTVLGLAVQNTLVQMLERETGIPSMTVARFLGQHQDLLKGEGGARLEAARTAMSGTVVVLDEASMVGNADMEKLVRLANLLRLDRFASIGDTKQLGAVDAGKPFDVMQQAGIEAAQMDTNLRARDEALRSAQRAAQGGRISEALAHLGGNVVAAGENAAVDAAAAWLSLAPKEREVTAIYASGRALRGEVNEAVQTGLKANGELGPGAMKLEVLSRINTTREELRYAKSYAPGMVLEVDRRQRGQGLQKGQYEVVGTDPSRERVTLQNERGRQSEFRPGQLRPQGEGDSLKLYERREIEIHDGDRIRWTATDHRRGLLNADQARIVAVDAKGVSLATSVGVLHRLAPDDPMLKRLDLAYALNAHMAQGLTSDRGIAVMDSREKNLANQQTFLVTITRLRDRLTLFVDNAGKLEAAVENNPGMKRSALETVDLLRNAAATGAEKVRASEAERKAPELDRSISKKFDMGL